MDRTVLEAERSCVEIARGWGLHCGKPLRWERDCLFVPRFDRMVTPAGVARLGLESLCSALGVAEFGHVFTHEELCRAIARFSSAPDLDLLEYVSRDVLNLALANSDNHGRNTAFLKDGHTVRLSPIFDLAPRVRSLLGTSLVCGLPAPVVERCRPRWEVLAQDMETTA